MSKSKSKSKSRRPSGVTMTTNRAGQITLRSYGPNAPDLRDVVPGLFAGTRVPTRVSKPAPAKPSDADNDDDDECPTCLGAMRIRDGETGELRRCLDCGGSGAQ